MRVAASYSLHVAGGIYSASQSNVPCGLQSEQLTSCMQIMFTLLWKRRISNGSGKDCFLVSVPALLVWEHINNSPYSRGTAGSGDS